MGPDAVEAFGDADGVVEDGVGGVVGVGFFGGVGLIEKEDVVNYTLLGGRGFASGVRAD